MRLDPALEAARKGRWQSPQHSFYWHEELPIAVDPNAHACLRGFENAVLAELPHLGCNGTLGCELQFVQTDTHQVQRTPYSVN